MKTIFGTKGNMTQTYIEGFRIPVTKVVAGPCTVVAIKNEQKDGYWAMQLGFGQKRIKNITKALQGHLKASKTTPRYIKEVRLEKEPEQKVGDVVSLDQVFKKGDVVSVSGSTKGKGFAGGVRRFNFRGGPKTHGQSDRHRAPGSVGQTTTPGRVYKGKRMAGRMGNVTITVKNLHIVDLIKDTNELLISGALPGRVGSLLTINRIKEGSLKDLEHEVVAQVVEGEPEKAEVEAK